MWRSSIITHRLGCISEIGANKSIPSNFQLLKLLESLASYLWLCKWAFWFRRSEMLNAWKAPTGRDWNEYKLIQVEWNSSINMAASKLLSLNFEIEITYLYFGGLQPRTASDRWKFEIDLNDHCRHYTWSCKCWRRMMHPPMECLLAESVGL